MMQDGTGQNGTAELTPRQKRAITVLLTTPTVEEAARTAKVSRSRLYVWLQDPAFSSALEQARREQSREALNFLRGCLLRAVQRLDALLSGNNETIAYRAAVALLDHGLKAVELEDLTRRIERLETQNEQLERSSAPAGARPSNGGCGSL